MRESCIFGKPGTAVLELGALTGYSEFCLVFLLKREIGCPVVLSDLLKLP